MKKMKEEVLEIVNGNCDKIKSELEKKGYLIKVESDKNKCYIDVLKEKEWIYKYRIDLIWEKGWLILEQKTPGDNKFYLMKINEVSDDDIYKHFFKYFEESPGDICNT